jgi:hypothetical protein
MSIVASIKSAWRKNSPELRGLFNKALPDFVARRRPRDQTHGVPVFCYHIADPESFTADLDFLARNGYTTISATEMLRYLRGELKLLQRSVMLSFDDGPKNFFDVTFPLLKRYNAKAVAFVAPGLHSDAAHNESGDARPMSWEEMRIIHATGLVEFQSHTLQSCYAPNWPMVVPLAGCDPKLENKRRRASLPFKEDLVRSTTELEAQLPGAKVTQLAWPMYDGTAEAVEAAREVGFEACYWGLVPNRPVNRKGDSPFFISRISEEYVRRLPGAGRISVADLIRGRLQRIQAAKAWRRQYMPAPIGESRPAA